MRLAAVGSAEQSGDVHESAGRRTRHGIGLGSDSKVQLEIIKREESTLLMAPLLTL